jgi:hypothetical protein
MAGFLYKLGFIRTLGKVDTAAFLTPEFEEQWKKALTGRKMGGKIGHRTKDKDGKELDNIQSELKVYYSYDEVKSILAGKGEPGVVGNTMSSVQEAPKAKAPWD